MPFIQNGAHAQANFESYTDIAGDQINDNRIVHYHEASQDILTKLNPVGHASFKSDRYSSCLEGTRTGVLEKLMKWAQDPDSQPIFWLSGIAGTGKSTISQSFCEYLQKQNLLGASFFCSRESEDLRQVGRIIPTLACDFAREFKEYHDQILIALQADSTLASQGIKRQLESLFMHPLRNTVINKSSGHFILVIDALDECEDRDATQNILSILRTIPAQFYSHLHIFISCRPEYYIQQELERTSDKDLFQLHDIESEIVHKDIQLYLKSSLYSMSENEITCLAEQAGKLFIYASTQVKYLKDAPGPVAMRTRLAELQGPKFSTQSIDKLYSLVLERAVEHMSPTEKEDAKCFINIIVSLSDPLSQHSLSELWKPCEVAPFRSVLNVPESEEAPIHIFHASFPDYILDKSRCHKEFSCDIGEIHRMMTLACVQYINKNLRFNPCNMQTDDHASSFAVEQISPALRYSCRYWMFHLVRCRSVDNEIFKEMENFVNNYFFFWIEHLGIFDSVENAISGLQSVSNRLQKHNNKGSKFLHSVTYEGRRFLQLIASLIKDYPLQLYYSGMAWLPRESVLHKVNNTLLNHPRVLHGLKNDWDMNERTIRCSGNVSCVGFSPDGKYVVSGSTEHTVCIWNLFTGEQIGKFDQLNYVCSVAFSPDGKLVVSASLNKIWIWDIATAEVIWKLESQATEHVRCVTFSPDGKQISFGSQNGTICIWDVATGRQIYELEGHSDEVRSVTFSPDGKQLVSGANDTTANIWNVATGKQIHHLTGHYSAVCSVEFSSDGKQVVSGSLDHRIYIWNVATGKQTHELKNHSGVWSVAFSPDGKQLVSGANDYSVHIWDVATRKRTHKLEGHSESVHSVAFSPDGKQVVSGSSDCTVRIWNVSAQKQVHKPGKHAHWKKPMAFSPNGKQLVFASGASGDSTVYIWDVSTGKQIHKLQVLGLILGSNSVAFSSDGKQVAFGLYQSLCIYNVSTGKRTRSLRGYPTAVSLAFSVDGKYLASGSSDKTLCVFDIATGKRILELEGHSDGSVNAVAFSPNGKQIVSGSDDYTLCVWDVTTGKQIRLFVGHSDRVTAVAFSPNGKQVVSGSWDQTISIWDVGFAMKTHTINTEIYTNGFISVIESIAFTSDGKELVAQCNRDPKVYKWSIATQKQNVTYDTQIPTFLEDGFLHFSEPNHARPRKFWLLPQYQNLYRMHQHDSTICFVCYGGGLLLDGALIIVQIDPQSGPHSDIRSVDSPSMRRQNWASRIISNAKDFIL